MMMKLLSPTLLLLIFSLLCTTTSGQPSAPAQAPSGSTTTSGQSSSPPAPSPSGPLAPSASSGPADIIAILRKTRKFSTFIGLLKSTQMDSEINSELKKKSNAGFTIFLPNALYISMSPCNHFRKQFQYF
ncbi:hypothetical protein AAG906_014568 [Vitis piasezkii]